MIDFLVVGSMIINSRSPVGKSQTGLMLLWARRVPVRDELEAREQRDPTTAEVLPRMLRNEI